MEQDLNDICDALEEMIDAADDAWEAEQRGSINKRNSIKESRYDPAKQRFKQALDQYIDNRIQKYNKNKDDFHYNFDGDHDL
jgi:hypothetical protein